MKNRASISDFGFDFNALLAIGFLMLGYRFCSIQLGLILRQNQMFDQPVISYYFLGFYTHSFHSQDRVCKKIFPLNTILLPIHGYW
ncbi:MAG: hypothetical protein NTV43_00945 [Methylococcales bacterium]|nr:hypothetical protein [Methylococcales bacterium]